MPDHIDRLDTVFSLFVRLFYADQSGTCVCFTCGRPCNYRDCDAAHGVPRQHQMVRYDLRNVHIGCHECNRINYGEMEAYAIAVDKKYGAGTWDELRSLSRQTCKRTKAEINEMAQHYRSEVARLKKEKGL
jgi:hypothetical protein